MRGRLIVLGAAALAMPWSIARSFGPGIDPLLALMLAGLAVVSAATLFALAARLFRNLSGPPWVRVIADILPALPFLLMVSRLASSTSTEMSGVNTSIALALSANEIVAGMALPLVAIAFTLRFKRQGVRLDRPKLVDLTFLGLVSLYTFIPVFKRQLDLIDGIVLLLLFMLYLISSSRFRQPALSAGPLEELLIMLPQANRVVAAFALVVYALFAMFVSAGAFAENLALFAARSGGDPVAWVQWIGPAVALGPAILMSIRASFQGNHQRAMGDMVSLKLVLLTAAIAFIPLGNASGTGNYLPLPLDPFQGTQFLLVGAQSLFLLAVLLTLSMTQVEAVVIVLLFFIQILIPDAVIRQVFVVGYVVMAIASLALERRKIGVLRIAPALTFDVLRAKSDAIESLKTIPDTQQPSTPTKPGVPSRRKRNNSRRR